MAADPAFLIMPGRGADESFVVIAPAVIARSNSDAAILFIPLLEIASSLPLLAMTAGAMTAGAMTTGLMLVCHRYNENCCKVTHDAAGTGTLRRGWPD
jgi:hypothetical protein